MNYYNGPRGPVLYHLLDVDHPVVIPDFQIEVRFQEP